MTYRDQSPWRADNIRRLTRADHDELRQIWRRPHVSGWESIPCPCGICRADRFVNRAAGILVGLCIGYFSAHLLIFAIR